jgi:hypothetical protein
MLGLGPDQRIVQLFGIVFRAVAHRAPGLGRLLRGEIDASTPRRVIAVLVGTLAVAAAAGAAYGAIGSGDSQSRHAPARTKVLPDRWELVGAVGLGRGLYIRYESAACGLGAAQISVRESSASISIGVDQRVSTASNVSCSGVAEFPVVKVHLAQPIDGRSIRGGVSSLGPFRAFRSRAIPDPPHSPILLPLVPDVVGFSVRDAKEVLINDGLHGRSLFEVGEVVGQKPSPGQLAPGTTRARPRGGVVTLMASHPV